MDAGPQAQVPTPSAATGGEPVATAVAPPGAGTPPPAGQLAAGGS